MVIETIKDLIDKALRAKEAQPVVAPTVGPEPKLNTLEYSQLLMDYYHLTTCSELNELEAKRLDRILWLAESDDLLSLLIEEIDQLTFQELGLLSADNLQQLKQQEANFEMLLTEAIPEDSEDTLTKQSLPLSIQPFERYRPVLQDYRRLTSQSELSEIEEKRLERIMRSAESDGLLNILIDQLEAVTLEAEERPADSSWSQSAQPCKHSRTHRQKRPRYLLPLKLGVGALLIALGTYHFLAVTNQGNRTTKTAIKSEIAQEVAVRQQLEKSELLAQEAMQQTELAQESKKLALYKAAIIRWEQALDPLRKIPSTSPVSSQARAKLETYEQEIQTLKEIIATEEIANQISTQEDLYSQPALDAPQDREHAVSR